MTLLDRRVSRAHVTAFNAGFMSAQDVRSPKTSCVVRPFPPFLPFIVRGFAG